MLYATRSARRSPRRWRRDGRVILYGEDVADYGGAFKLTKGLLEAFGRERVFNTPISEAAICGTAVGAAMVGLRPVVELMYMDFALMASDQIANQAAKWHYMSGAQTRCPSSSAPRSVPARATAASTRSRSRACSPIRPGCRGVSPDRGATPRACSSPPSAANNPVLFVESQGLYATRARSPTTRVLVPIGEARVAREGDDVTIVAWGPAVADALRAADELAAEGIECEVIDLRTLVPLDMDTVLASVRKTGRCVVASQAVLVGSYVNEIVARIMSEAFDDLDAPVARVGAGDGISPQAESLERAFLPTPSDIVEAVRGLI